MVGCRALWQLGTMYCVVAPGSSFRTSAVRKLSVTLLVIVPALAIGCVAHAALRGRRRSIRLAHEQVERARALVTWPLGRVKDRLQLGAGQVRIAGLLLDPDLGPKLELGGKLHQMERQPLVGGPASW
eukprot:1837815-Prymnesium_polylepis.2